MTFRTLAVCIVCLLTLSPLIVSAREHDVRVQRGEGVAHERIERVASDASVHQDVNDTPTPYDADGNSNGGGVTSCSKTLTTTVDNDLLLAWVMKTGSAENVAQGSGQTEEWDERPYGSFETWAGGTKETTAAGSQDMSFSWSTSGSCEELMLALRAASSGETASTTPYLYAGTGYANPHAVTQIGGTATTTYTYDKNGNLTNATSTAMTTVYQWDYRNRMATSTINGKATTTYAYDHSNENVWKKVGTAATTTYPNKYYEVQGATSTAYIYLPDGTLAAMVVGAGGGGGGGATSTGFKTTGTVEVSTGWSGFTTTNINTSDNAYATCSSVCDDSDDAQTSDYSFGIPTDATVNGIEVTLEGKESISTGNIPVNVSLSWNDGANFTTTKTATVDGTSDVVYTLGGSADTWGRSWDDSEFANGTFRARFDKTSTTDTLSIDQIRIKVYYTTSGGGGSSATTTYYVHTDHLGGTNIVTNASGTVVQVLDYYPYGTKRIDSGAQTTDRQYIGQRYDSSVDLNYLNARYYSSGRGQFISQDPIFTGDPRRQNLANPQSLNSYSYAENNPIVKKDPDGLAANSADAARQAQIGEIKKQIGAIQTKINQIAASMQRTGGQFYGGMWNPISGGSATMNTSLPWYERTAAGIGTAVGVAGSIFQPELRAAKIADEAIVIRGGLPKNFEPGAFKIGPSRTEGVEGFSAQCANGACAADLAKYIKNSYFGQTTAATIRAAGGDVISTPGTGFHVTITGLDGAKASEIPWQFFKNITQ